MPAPINALTVQNVQPAPTAVIHTVALVRLNGVSMLALKLDDNTGSKVSFFTLDDAKKLAEVIRMTAAGIQLPTQPPTLNGGIQQ